MVCFGCNQKGEVHKQADSPLLLQTLKSRDTTAPLLLNLRILELSLCCIEVACIEVWIIVPPQGPRNSKLPASHQRLGLSHNTLGEGASFCDPYEHTCAIKAFKTWVPLQQGLS